MLFMVSSRPKPGVTREQMAEHLSRRMHPSTWDLVRHGALSNLFYKVGDEPGFVAVLSAPTVEDARATVERGTERLEVFELDIVPVNQFPDFD